MPDLSPLRWRMVDAQLARRGIQDRSVMAAMGKVPREAFDRGGPRGVRSMPTRRYPSAKNRPSPNPTSSP